MINRRIAENGGLDEIAAEVWAAYDKPNSRSRADIDDEYYDWG
jgi:hypothetical protein